MSSIQLLEKTALATGFVRTTCVHENNDSHIVYDYPGPLKHTTTVPHWRVHTDMDRKQRRTYIVGRDTDQQQVSLKNAGDFMQRVSRQYPKGTE
jgi:hypothetical protein